MNSLVTVLINNYNYGRFVCDAINSVLSQTYQDIEIIVVDDGSTDDSETILKDFGDRIQCVFKKNGGQASAFNVGFAKSRGEIICFLDADDLFVEDKIAKIVSIFEKHSEVDWCFHPQTFVDRNLEKMGEDPEHQGLSGVYDVRKYVEKGKLTGTLPFDGTATSGLCFRRSLLEKLLPMPESIRITSDDYLKFAAFGISQGFVCLESLSLQRIHNNNAYTFREDPKKIRLEAKIQILTAYWLRKNFPSIIQFTNKLFALGNAVYQKEEIKDDELQKIVETYFSSVKIVDKISIRLRSLYYSFKQ